MVPNRRRQGPSFALLLLATQLFRVGFDNIPPVTLITIIGQVVTFLRLLDIDWPSVTDVCVSPAHVWFYGDWKRCFLAAFFHLDDWHLYYNMVSFLWKGISLERSLGSGYFALVIAVFAFLTNVVLVGLNLVLAEYVLNDSSYMMQCAAGFSGVLFALKVLTTYQLPPGIQYIMGFLPVPSRLAVWAELIVIQLLVPRVSFTGHLAGILVGLFYVHGPLGGLMRFVYSAATGGRGHYETHQPDSDRYQRQQHYSYSGASGRQYDYAQYRAQPTAPPAEEGPPYPQSERGMPYPQAPDLERMRRSRLNRFDNYT